MLYVFECKNCSYQEEKFQSYYEKDFGYCAKCDSREIIRYHVDLGLSLGVINRSTYKDRSGERIDFKEPYFDLALRRPFKSAKEKAEYMNSKGIVSSGDSDAKCKKQKKQYTEKKGDVGHDNVGLLE